MTEQKFYLLQLRGVTKDGKMPLRKWAATKTQFAVMFGDRFEVNR